MNNMQRVSIAATIVKDIDLLKYMHAVAFVALTDKWVPEAYTFISEVIISNYRVSIYNMNNVGVAYYVQINNLGTFQIL